MIIIAHRGNSTGPQKETENTPEAISYCLSQGWGVETDIRRDEKGLFYIAHDKTRLTPQNDANLHCRAWKGHPKAVIALNIKELGYEDALADFLQAQGVLDQVFLFDMEFLEAKPGSTARYWEAKYPLLRLAVRVSDRAEPIERALHIEAADIVWLDEFDRLWATEKDIGLLKSNGKIIYAISPELHGFGLDTMKRRWLEFSQWGVDGICTDYPSLIAAKNMM